MIVPTVEESEHRDHADNLDDLLIGPMLAERHEHFVGGGIGADAPATAKSSAARSASLNSGLS